MATASVEYTFTGGTQATASEVNQSFTDLVNFLNASVVHVDGSKTMTGILALPSSNPTSADQATRKAYVDDGNIRRPTAVNPASRAQGAAYVPGTNQLLLRAGSSVITTNGSGIATISFGGAFPVGVGTVVVVNGDADTLAVNFHLTNVELNDFTVFATTVGTGAVTASQQLRCNWIALGW